MIKKMKRSQKDRVIAGFFGGLGDYFNTDPVLLRVLGVFLLFWNGFWAFVVYIVAVLIIPVKDETEEGQGEVSVGSNEREQKFWRLLLLVILIILLLVPAIGLFGVSRFMFNVQPEVFFESIISENYEGRPIGDNLMVQEESWPVIEKSLINDHLEVEVLEPGEDSEIFASHQKLGRDRNHVYIWAQVTRYRLSDGELELIQGRSGPAIILTDEYGITGSLIMEEDNLSKVIGQFPDRLRDRIMNFRSNERAVIDHLENEAEMKARNFYGL